MGERWDDDDDCGCGRSNNNNSVSPTNKKLFLSRKVKLLLISQCDESANNKSLRCDESRGEMLMQLLCIN